MVVGPYATSYVVHVSIRTAMMGRMLPVYAIFVLPPALVLWAAATGRLTDGVRRAWLVATIVLACGAFTLLRTDGVKGMGFPTDLALVTNSGGAAPGSDGEMSRPTRRCLTPAAASTPAPEIPSAPTNQPSTSHQQVLSNDRPSQPRESCGRRTGRDARSRQTGRMAGFPRPGSRRRCSRCADQYRLGHDAARPDLATGRSGPGGRRLRSAEICSTRRSSEARTRSWRATGSATASRCGVIETRCVSGVERRRRPAGDTDAQRRTCLRVWRDRALERARRRRTARSCGRATWRRMRDKKVPMGFLELTARARRPGRRRRFREARGLRHRNREVPMVRTGSSGQLQLSASSDDRRDRPDSAAHRGRRHQRRASGWRRALGTFVAGGGQRSCNRP